MPQLPFSLTLLAALLVQGASLRCEDGSQLWLRHAPLDAALRQAWAGSATCILAEGGSATEKLAAEELRQGLGRLLGREIPLCESLQQGALVLGTLKSSPLVRSWKMDGEVKAQGPEGFVIRQGALAGGQAAMVIASESPQGCLYGAFHLLRLAGTGKRPAEISAAESPKLRRRLLNHWDNLDRSIERGYAGKSLWNWEELPGRVDARVTEYARANASLGLNGAVLNNVNTNPAILRPGYLAKAKALADALRPWGLRVYLSANFGTPKAFGETATADPFDPAVKRWWKRKADEIYALIPDFGGFLVKANSEGQPGPLDYGRTHADGANMLAKALKPHGGVVIWRAFVYNAAVDRDRVKRAYLELMPLDGKFEKNVFIQAKNGALDFQPREPFHPLFTAMKKTAIGAELQVTQEYLGHSTHLAYLGPMWEEFFNGAGPAWRQGRDSLIAGVANTGTDPNWCGHDFAQANWYAYGRLAWNPGYPAGGIASEWIRQTWTREEAAVKAIRGIMDPSRQAVVDYTSPLGLAGVFERDIHYAPDPGMVDERHDDWSAAYFVRASRDGLGYERGRKGSGAVDQYEKTLADRFDSLEHCPEEFLLWFHHVGWDQKLKGGKTLIEELKARFARGVSAARQMEKDWAGLKAWVDPQRHRAVAGKLRIQAREAAAWARKSLDYYEGVRSGRLSGHPFGPSFGGPPPASP